MKIITGAITGVALAIAGAAGAQDVELPKQLSWTAYDTGSAGFNQAVAIGGELQKAYGTSLRVLPGKNDISRAQPLRQGRVDFSATGIGGSFMAQEGAFEFAEKGWGPQPLRVLLANASDEFNLSVAAAGDAGIDSFADIKGKRVPLIAGAPGLNENMKAYLAYGGLTWDDVTVVEFGGYGAAWTGLIEDQVDVMFGSTNTGPGYEAAAGPRGLKWIPMDPEDEEAFNRLTDITPYYRRNTATVGATIDGTEGVQGATYAYPVLVAMEDADTDLVYNMTRAMVELFPKYDGKAPAVGGWNIKNQDFTWVMPYHEGAIAYFREIGVWSDEAQAHNDELIRRQEVLQKAWAELEAENPENWVEVWTQARRDALKAAGLQVVF